MRDESAPADAGRTPFGIAVAGGAVAMAAATMLAALLFPAGAPGGLVLVALAVGWYGAAVADTRASLVTAALGFLLFDGFFANRYGELTWEGTTSLWHLTVFVLAVGIGLGQRWIWHACDSHVMDDEIVEDTETRMKETHGG